MNKLLIPAILAAIVVVAGIFAFMPIEKASTVHTTITGQLVTTNTADDQVMTAAINIIADSATIKEGVVCLKVTDDADPDNDTPLRVGLTSGGGLVDLLSDNAIEDAGGECSSFSGFSLVLTAGETDDTVDFVVSYTVSNP